MRDDPRCLHCGLRHPRSAPCIPVLPAPDIPSEWPRIEAEREARIRADERAAIVARIRRGAANPWTPEPDRHAWERLADLIEMEEHDDHP